MVHRDPDTGQFQAGMDGGLTYSDHDVHHVLHELRYLDTADAGPTTFTSDTQQFEITERGLDPDELAELRGIRVTASLRVQADGAQDSRGAVFCDIDAGFNLTGDEFLSVNPVADGIDVDDSGTNDFQSFTKDTDEVGQLYSERLSAGIGFDDDANSNGGVGGGEPVTSELISYPGLTGTGPVVDSVDDFSSRIGMSVSNVITTLACDVRYSLYYAVEESESGRTRFGR